ncbi:MAG: chromosome segregation protein SMC [Caulobacteraceae bacterium]|nr:chromosome segregation protein SMC [Caulobacteraceae bacterium]
MDFLRLRIAGFKSFVDPQEFRIEPGLTGIVGPNGCGKSNVLESLRWVMGANSAKAMRASGMDDVIFSGTSERPARNHAEVSLTIDNADRRAPEPFRDAPVLEVVRRIDRGDGSTYRVNGKEVRAKDVQLLFADASTGANSPALVRQGQISELIAAKPQNRRRILEEAGGVAGLHTRRHEAELRLRAAETNLNRLEDIAKELESTLGRLKREARQAERYKKISAEIRALQSAVLYARYADARDGLERLRAEMAEALRAVEDTTRAAAVAQAAAIEAQEGLKPLREEDAVSAAVLHRLTLERDRLEQEEMQARAEAQRLRDELARIGDDIEREEKMVDDAAAQLERLGSEIALLEAEAAAGPDRGPELEAAWRKAESTRSAAEAEVERLASQLAAQQARVAAEAARLRDAESRHARTFQALENARRDRAAVGPLVNPEAEGAQARLTEAVTALQAAREAVEQAEAARAAAAASESEARQSARQQEDRLGRMQTEARGLAQLLSSAKREFAAAVDSVRPTKGYEAALAAALGEDLDAALDPKAAAHWAGAEARAAEWPSGVEPLADRVEAPEALRARLAFVGVVGRQDGERLRRNLPVGGRLVSLEGDLWRWDGLTVRAEAEKPAAVRMAQRTRLNELEGEIDRARPEVEAATGALKAAADAVRVADEALRDARRRPGEIERTVAAARDAVERLAREQARNEARAQSLDDAVARLEIELADAAEAVKAATGTAEDGDTAPLMTQLAAARDNAEGARAAASQARVAFDSEARDRQARERRLFDLKHDLNGWTARRTSAAERIKRLEGDREKTQDALARAQAAPDAIVARRDALLDNFTAAEERRRKAADSLADAEAAAQAADAASRAAERDAAEARETRAGAAAREEAARERLAEVEAQVRETAQMSPEELGAKLQEDAVSAPADAAGAESLLYSLERERDALGPVNLRAEDEAAEYGGRLQTMKGERSDLTTAIAKLRDGIDELNAEGRERLLAAFDVINEHFKALFQALFNGGQAELRLVESDDPLEAGLEIYACPPGKRLASMSLMSGGEQALTAAALIFGVFLANPAPVCFLDEVDAPLDDANVDRFCRMLDEMRRRTDTRFVVITHNPVTMSRMDRLFGVTMAERGVSQLVSVDLTQAEALAAQ